jgi:small subunit ribosomal protein S17
MAALASSTSFIRGTAMRASPSMQAQPRAVAAFTPVRAAQSLTGKVVSTASEKTAVVAVDVLKVHPVYKKRVKFTNKIMAHDEAEVAKVGDVVTLAPTRPLSKRKRFLVTEVVKAAK